MDDHSVKPAKELIKLHKKFHSEIMRWLRKAFDWSGIKTLAKSKARIARGKYECQYCGNEVGTKGFEIDHFEPCISVEENSQIGYDYNGIVTRMFDMENSFLVCKPCHRVKTGKENSKRQTGVKRDKETKANIKKGMDNPQVKKKCSSGRKGKKNSEQSKKKVSTANKGKTGFTAYHSGGEYHTDNGVFGSMPDAAKANNCSIMAIMSRCYKFHNNGKPVSERHKEKYINWKFVPKK